MTRVLRFLLLFKGPKDETKDTATYTIAWGSGMDADNHTPLASETVRAGDRLVRRYPTGIYIYLEDRDWVLQTPPHTHLMRVCGNPVSVLSGR